MTEKTKIITNLSSLLINKIILGKNSMLNNLNN